MTNDLATFLSRLSGTFDGAALAPTDPAARAYLERLLMLPLSEQRRILAALRDQTAVCVLLLRNQKQDEKADYEARQAAARRDPHDPTSGTVDWAHVPVWPGTPESGDSDPSSPEETEETEPE